VQESKNGMRKSYRITKKMTNKMCERNHRREYYGPRAEKGREFTRQTRAILNERGTAVEDVLYLKRGGGDNAKHPDWEVANFEEELTKQRE